jgi:hypothetical protein
MKEAGVAQLVAQTTCNRQVVGSSPTTGSAGPTGSTRSTGSTGSTGVRAPPAYGLVSGVEVDASTLRRRRHKRLTRLGQ